MAGIRPWEPKKQINEAIDLSRNSGEKVATEGRGI